MGSFAGYRGDLHIPEHLKARFSEQMARLLNYGGMMDIDSVSLYDWEISLLKPVELRPEEDICFFYNYFEDDMWEDAGYDISDTCLWSNKVGNREFERVMIAAYSLYER